MSTLFRMWTTDFRSFHGWNLIVPQRRTRTRRSYSNPTDQPRRAALAAECGFCSRCVRVHTDLHIISHDAFVQHVCSVDWTMIPRLYLPTLVAPTTAALPDAAQLTVTHSPAIQGANLLRSKVGRSLVMHFVLAILDQLCPKYFYTCGDIPSIWDTLGAHLPST